jgi:hypothetical protein
MKAISKSRPAGERASATPTKGFVLGRQRFAKISAVEGIDLDGDVRRELEAFDAMGLSSDARRAAVKAKYGKHKA